MISELWLTKRLYRDVNEGTVFLMNVYLNVMAELQKEKKNIKKQIFQSGSQSLIIAKKCFVQVKSFTRQQNKTDQSIQTISMAGRTGTFRI